MTHIQQKSNTTDSWIPTAIAADDQKNYVEQDTEFGAENKAQIMAIRNAKPPEDALKPLNPFEVNAAIEKTQAAPMNYSGFKDETLDVKNQLKKYMQKMIVKNNTENQEGTATT